MSKIVKKFSSNYSVSFTITDIVTLRSTHLKLKINKDLNEMKGASIEKKVSYMC